MSNEACFVEVGPQHHQAGTISLESLTSMFLKSFEDHHIDIPFSNVEKWMKDWAPVEQYLHATRPIGSIGSYASPEEQTKHFVSLLLCFAIDFNSSIEDTRDTFCSGEDDSLLLLLIIYTELFVAHVRGPAHFAVKHACIIEDYLHEFCDAAKDLLTGLRPVVLTANSGCRPQGARPAGSSISVMLICHVLWFLLPKTKVDRFKLCHAKLQHVPYYLIADTTIGLTWRCAMVNYIVENRLIWEKDVDSDVFLTSVFKPCLDGINSLVLQLDLHTDAGIMQLLKSMLFIYLLIETYDIDRLFKILKDADSSFADTDYNGTASYFGFLDAVSIRSVHTTDPNARKTLVRTRSVSNLQTHSLTMPSSNQPTTITSFTCFITLLTTWAKLIYTQRDELMTNPCAFQEICRLLFCSVSVLLFSLLTCLGNLSSSAVPLSLTNFSYILRCGLLFVGANPLGKATELEYQAACLLYHLDKVVQCHLDTVAHQKLDLLGFIEDDKLRNTKDFLFRQVHAEKDAEHNNNVCSYFGLSSEEVGLSGVTPVHLKYTSAGSLYLLPTVSNDLFSPGPSYLIQSAADPCLHTLPFLRTQVVAAVQFIIFHVAQHENAIISGSFYPETISIKILDPQFSAVIEVIAEYLSHEELSIDKDLSELLSSSFIQSLMLLLYAYSVCYSKQFLDKNNILYSQRYHLLSVIVQLILDLLLTLPHESVLSALLYKPELCLLPSALLSIFQSLSCPKQIHLHMPLLLVVLDLFNEFVCRVTKYTTACPALTSPCDNDISADVKTLVSSTDFAKSAINLMERLITGEWANIGRNCSSVVELLLLGLIEYFHLSPKSTTLLTQQRKVPLHIIKFLKSITLHMQTKQPIESSKSSSEDIVLFSAMGDISFLMNSRTIEISISILLFYKSDLITFIKDSYSTGTLECIVNIFLSNPPRYPYSRCRYLPFFAYVFIYGYPNKSLAHTAGSVIWTSANYLLWPSSLLYGFLDTLAILRTSRHSFGFYNLLLHQLFAGILGRNSLDRLSSFPSVLQLKQALEPRAQFNDILELECCAPYAKQQEMEPLPFCIVIIEHLLSLFKIQKPLSTWQSVQALAVPSLSVKDIFSVNLPDALFNIRENEVQIRRGPHMQKFKQFLMRVFYLNNTHNAKRIQSFASVCSLRSHIIYLSNRLRNDPLLPLILLFILLHTTCSLKNWIYEIAGWTTAYECVPVFTNTLCSIWHAIPALMQESDCNDLHHKYLHLLVDLLEELLLNSFHSPQRLSTTSGVLRSTYDNARTMRKKHSPSEFKVDSTLSPANMYYADGQLIFNTAAVFAIWTGYLHLLLSFLTTKNVVATVESAKINPLKLVLVLTALLENCWVVSSACSPNSFIQPLCSNISKLQSQALPLMVQLLADMCSLPNECEYINFILSCERSDVPNFSILKSLIKKFNVGAYQHHKTKGKQRIASPPTLLSVNSLEIEKSHAFICQQLKKYFKDDDIICWLFKNKWSFFHVARSVNIALCAKLGFEFYHTRLSDPGFEDFLCNLLHYFRFFYNPRAMQWVAFSEKVTNHNQIFSQIEVDCPGFPELPSCSLVDLIVHTLKLSLAVPSLLGNSVRLLEVLSFVTLLSNHIFHPNSSFTYEDIQVLSSVLQLVLQSHNPREFEKGVMAIHAVIANLFILEEEYHRVPSCTIVTRAELSTRYDSVLQEDTGLKLLLRGGSAMLPLSPSLIPVASLRFMLEHKGWNNSETTTLVIALIEFIFSREHRASIFLSSQVCFQLLNNMIATNLIDSYCKKMKIIQTMMEGIRILPLSKLCTSDLSFSTRYDVFVLCLHAVTYKLQQDIRTCAPGSIDMTKLLPNTNVLQREEEAKQNTNAYSSAREVLCTEDKKSYGCLVQALKDYCTECVFPHSPMYSDLHETIPIPNQMQPPNRCIFEDLGDESLALSP
ncbi:hypothetical protein GL50803_0017439 [Giardia duodenalis]|uniref:Uncharacterized protein n=1 Tax=Giardia intestinalis (strain ATCC 50803 / WB clone C6) TaxID=184922 RepID=D3KGZ4_GIAIC|nr:hypothetical protein GL50803_0017439 [Giardia intestinalis]KAE8304148.1 hypothetical protein GL50803_0017439 [Giardia intestinalis]